MKSILLCCLLVLSAVCADSTWDAYKAKHGKSYSAAEEVRRKALYAKTHASIEAHNQRHAAGLETYAMAHNKLSDMLPEERAALKGFRPKPKGRGSRSANFDLAGDDRQITAASTTKPPTTVASTTKAPTTVASTTKAPTTVASTTKAPTTVASTTKPPTTVASTTKAPTTVASTTKPPTTVASTTKAPTTVVSTTKAPTTVASTTKAPTTVASTTKAPTTVASTTKAPTTVASTTKSPTTVTPTLPTSYDLRTSTCMPPIKNQGACGDCWTFATVAPIEFQYCMKHNNNVSVNLSEQQVTDCTYTYDGCQGGDHHDAWAMIYSKGGLEPTSAYPFVSGTSGVANACAFSSTKVVAKLANGVGTDIPQMNEPAMQAALVAYGPITFAYYVSNNFDFYSSGVFSDSTCLTDYNSLNHEMTIVGYGVSGTTPYWIVRNQWGTGWGMSGYAYIRRGTNECGIAMEAGYPTVV